MTFLQPLALVAGLVLPAIVLIYLLKKRTRPQTVSSIMLWLRLERINTPALKISRLFKSILLALQLLVALLLVLALARPVLDLAGGTTRTTIVVIDTSISMAVADETRGTRLEEALAQVGSMIQSKSPQDQVAIIAMGENVDVVSGFSRDGLALMTALERVTIQSSRPDVSAALSLAQTMAMDQEDAQIILYSDGAFAGLPRLEIALRFVGLGQDQVTNLSIQDMVPDGERLYVILYNNGTQAASGRVEIEDQGGKVIGRRDVELAPGSSETLVWRNLPPSDWYVANIISSQDQLALDNQSFALSRPSVPGRLLLVSEGNMFLERALLLYPGLAVSRVAPQAYRDEMAGRYDLFVWDGFLPSKLPQAPMIVFDPPHPNPHFSTTEPMEARGLTALAHPLLRHADFSEVSIVYSKTLLGGSGLLQTQGRLVATQLDMGSPMVVFGFPIQAGDLALRPAFPIMLRNIIDEFTGHGHYALPLSYNQPAPWNLVWLSQDNKSVPQGQNLKAGIYQGEQRNFALNVPNTLESLAARGELDLGGETVPARQSGRTGPPLFLSLVLVALALVGLEWWVDHGN